MAQTNASATPGPTSLGLGGLQFDKGVLAESLRDSGICAEFGLDEDAQLLLAAQGLVIVSLALSSVTDEAFEAGLAELDAPDNPEELAFLTGYCEHVRQICLSAFPDDYQNELRPLLKRRVDRARQLARDAIRLL